MPGKLHQDSRRRLHPRQTQTAPGKPRRNFASEEPRSLTLSPLGDTGVLQGTLPIYLVNHIRLNVVRSDSRNKRRKQATISPGK
jgi:hypothetical protein